MGEKCVKRMKWVSFVIAFVAMLSVNFLSTHIVYAGGWVNHYQENIYKQPKPDIGEIEDFDYGGEFGDGSEEPGMIEGFFAELIHDLAVVWNKASTSWGMDVDAIILGRVNYGLSQRNMFGFELVEGNVYGIIGSIVYGILRSIIFIVLAIELAAYFVRAIWKNTGKTKEELKENVSSIVIRIIMLVLMPYFLDIAIYIRDMMLSILRDGITSAAGLYGLDIFESATVMYNASGGKLLPAIMEFAVGLISLFFVINYAVLALTCLVMFIAFPFVVCYPGSRGKQVLYTWIEMFACNLLIPIVDYILLMVVILFQAVLGTGVAQCIVQIVLISQIKLARQTIMRLVGINSPATNSGIGGFAMLFAAGKMLSSAVGAVTNAGSRFKSAKEDKENEETERELGGGSDDSAGYDPTWNVNDSESDLSEDNDVSDNDLSNSESSWDSDGIDESDIDNSELNQNGDENEYSDNEESDDGDGRDLDEDYDYSSGSEEGIEGSDNDIEADLDGAGVAAMTAEQANSQLAALQGDTVHKEQKPQQLVSEGRGSSKEAQALKGDIEANKAKMQNASKTSQDGRNQTADNSYVSNRHNSYEALNGNHHSGSGYGQKDSYGSKWTNRYNPDTATPEERRLHDIALKRANINNFDTPKFEGMLSHQEMADFYKKRAMKNIVSGTGGLIGSGVLGFGVGGLVGSMSALGGPGVMLTVAGFGASYGAGAGGYVGEKAATAGQKVGEYISSRNSGDKPKTRRGEAGRKMGVEPPDYRQDIRNQVEFGNLPPSGVENYSPSNIVDYDKEGDFWLNERANDISPEERMNRAAMASKYYALDNDRKNLLNKKVCQRFDTMIKVGDIQEENVEQAMRTEYMRGIENLDAEGQAAANRWIDELIACWRHR